VWPDHVVEERLHVQANRERPASLKVLKLNTQNRRR